DSAETFSRRGNCGEYLALVGNVASHRTRTPAGARDVARTVDGIFGARVDTDERGALGRETLGHAAADVRAGPGNQCHFSVQLHTIQRGGGAIRKHFEELKIQVSMNSVTAGL